MLKNFTKNPDIDRIYLEPDRNVLVIETSIARRGGARALKERIDGLLMDLDEVQVLAERQVGSFERIDIRFAA
jgi:hypothetical protein